MAAIARVAAMAAKVISLEPSMAACLLGFPNSKCLTIFSSIMMASSTTMPIARLNPKSVNVLRVNPKKYRAIKAPMIEVGMAIKTLMVEDHEPKNK